MSFKKMSGSEDIMISICCVTYNHESYIGRALDSFLAQRTSFRYEIIIRDDASQDNTAKIIKDYASRYHNIIIPILEDTNTWHLGSPMNTLFQRSRGRFIAICEGDDFWTDDRKLQKQVDFLVGNDEYSCVGHQTDIVNTQEQFLGLYSYGSLPMTLPTDRLLGSCPFHTSSLVAKGELLRNYPIPVDLLSGDKAILLLLSRLGKVGYLNTSMSCYRKHTGGITNNINIEKQRSDFVILKWISNVDHSFPVNKFKTHLYWVLIKNRKVTDKLFWKYFILYFVFSFSYFPSNLRGILRILTKKVKTVLND